MANKWITKPSSLSVAELLAQEFIMPEHDDSEFAKDLLRGAEEIAEYLYGDRRLRRKIYHLSATSNLPIFKLGSVICMRKSVLHKWLEDQEQRHANDNNEYTGKAVKSGKV